jgi:flagellar FliL protein
MAEEKKPEDIEVPKKKGKLLFIILALVGIIIVGGVGIAVWLLTSAPDKPKQAGAHGEQTEGGETEAQDEDHPPLYEKLEQFTVNLADQESYLQTEVQLLLADPKVQEKIKARMPEIRDAMIRLLSSKTAEELSQPEGKDKLANEIKQELNGVLGIKADSQGVKKVLFGALIIQ